MVVCTANNFIRKEKIKEFKEIASKFVEETHKENGCIEFQIYRDRNDETIFIFIEKWMSIEVLQTHINTKHFKELVPKINEMKYKDDEVKLYDVFI